MSTYHIGLFINAMITAIGSLIVIRTATQSDVKLVTFKNILIFLLTAIITFVAATTIYPIIKIIINLLLMGLAYYFIDPKTGIKKALFGSSYNFFIYFLADIASFILFVLILGISKDVIVNTGSGIIIAGMFTTSFAILFVKFKVIKQKLIKGILLINPRTIRMMSLSLVMMIISICIIWSRTFVTYGQKEIFILDLILIGIYSIAIGFVGIQTQKYAEQGLKNKLLIDKLEEYESVIESQNKISHDTKNEFIVIKEMINPSNKGLHSYLDELIKDRYERDQQNEKAVQKIPGGGLRGLIYFKGLLIKKNNIGFDVNSTKEVIDFYKKKIDSNTNFQLCKIVGILMDNAIEEASKLPNGKVDLDLRINDNELEISISNNYKSMPDISKLGNKNYSTKGSGRGFGLSIVKDIVNKNHKLINEKRISGQTFIQVIKVKV